MAFVDVLRLLESYGVLRAVDGATEAYVDVRGGEGPLPRGHHAADAAARRTRRRLPPGRTPGRGARAVRGTPHGAGARAALRRHGRGDGTTEDEHGETAATDAQRNLRLRHSVLRRLFDDPVLYREDLADDELAYVTSLTGRQILRRSVEQAGFVLEERAEGYLLVDPDGIATDARFPDDTSTARVAALLLLEPLCAAPAGLLPEQLAEAGADLLRRFPRWAKAYQSRGRRGPADRRRRTRTARCRPGPPDRGPCGRAPGRTPLPPNGDDGSVPEAEGDKPVSVMELPCPRQPEFPPPAAGIHRAGRDTGGGRRTHPAAAGSRTVRASSTSGATTTRPSPSTRAACCCAARTARASPRPWSCCCPSSSTPAFAPTACPRSAVPSAPCTGTSWAKGPPARPASGMCGWSSAASPTTAPSAGSAAGPVCRRACTPPGCHADYFTTGARIAHPGGVLLVNEAGQPLTRAALAEALHDRGDVHASATDHRTAVRRELFAGMGEQRYESLLSALLQLRQPKLSERLDPSLLSTLLSRALPPLGEGEIAELAEGFERLDRQREHLRRLDDEVAAADTVAARQRAYARRVLRAGSAALISATTEMDDLTRAARQSAEELEQALAQRESARTLREDQELRAHALEETVEGLRESDAYQQGEELDRLRRRTRDEAAAAGRLRTTAQAARATAEEDLEARRRGGGPRPHPRRARARGRRGSPHGRPGRRAWSPSTTRRTRSCARTPR